MLYRIYTGLLLASLLTACGGGSGGNSTPVNPQTGGNAQSCTTAVQGCDAANYSCPSAEFCYTDQNSCIASNECTGTVSTTGTPTSSSCTTNVAGCDSANFSCPAADFCYTDQASCAAGNECPGTGTTGTGTGTTPQTQTSSCTTNVTGCDANNYSCPAAAFCYINQADCDSSNECKLATKSGSANPLSDWAQAPQLKTAKFVERYPKGPLTDSE